MTKSRGILAPRKPWSEQDVELVRRDYPHMKTEKIARALGRTLHTVYQMAQKLGLHKTDDYMASADACRLRRDNPKRAEHRFKPGQAPANKGLRRPGWSTGRMRETQFKKGHRPKNWRHPIGSTRLIDGYQYEKILETSPWTKAWKLSHHLLWQRCGREIPKGHVLVFKDKNPKNITLDNLECVTLAENCRRNSYHTKYPKEVAQLIQLRGALQRQINKRERKAS